MGGGEFPGGTVTERGGRGGDGGSDPMSDTGDGISTGQPPPLPVSSASTGSSSPTSTHESSVGSVDTTKEPNSVEQTLGRTRLQTQILQQRQEQSLPVLPQGDRSS